MAIGLSMSPQVSSQNSGVSSLPISFGKEALVRSAEIGEAHRLFAAAVHQVECQRIAAGSADRDGKQLGRIGGRANLFGLAGGDDVAALILAEQDRAGIREFAGRRSCSCRCCRRAPSRRPRRPRLRPSNRGLRDQARRRSARGCIRRRAFRPRDRRAAAGLRGGLADVEPQRLADVAVAVADQDECSPSALNPIVALFSQSSSNPTPPIAGVGRIARLDPSSFLVSL